MSVSERFNKSTLTSMKLGELQNLAQTYDIEIKTVSQKTNNQINKKKAILIDEIMEFKKKDDDVPDTIFVERNIEEINDGDDKFNKFKEAVESYEKETGSDFIEEILLVKEMNEKMNTLMSDLLIDEFQDFQPNVYSHEFDDTSLSSISKKKPTEQYDYFSKIYECLKFGDIVIMSNSDCEVKKIYHVADGELAEDISLCDADWMSLGIPKEISKKFKNMDELLCIYLNHVIKAHEFSDDYFCVQLDSNHPFLKSKFGDIEDKHIKMMKDWDIRYLSNGESFKEDDEQDDECRSQEDSGMKNDFEIITPKTHEKYHCSEYYEKSIKKLIESYGIQILKK